jgi:hypothetical protein
MGKRILPRGMNEMAGLKGKSGPPGNITALKHGLAAIQKRCEEGVPAEHEESIRQQILDGRQGLSVAPILVLINPYRCRLPHEAGRAAVLGTNF